MLGISVIANTALAIALATMMPMKQMVPYFVESNSETGAVVVTKEVAKKFVADEMNRKFFAAKFVRELLTIDPYMTRKEYMPSAMATVMGKGSGQIREFLDFDKPIERLIQNPALSRVVDIRRVTLLPGSENVISIPVTLTTRSRDEQPKIEKKVVTIHYTVGQPLESEQAILRNPIGFFVTQFTIDEEFGK
jgi:type IV secretion system protein VirB8